MRAQKGNLNVRWQKIKDPANARPLKAFSFSSEEPIRFEVIA